MSFGEYGIVSPLIYNVVEMNSAHYMTSYTGNFIRNSKTDHVDLQWHLIRNTRR